MKKEIITIAVLFALAIVFSIYFDAESNQNTVCIKEECFNVEVAQTSEERQRGLMFRESLGADEGMFFVFDGQGTYPFWMKNTLIPLDIIWIDNNLKIVHIASNVQPCESDPCPSVIPGAEATYVLEIASGRATEVGIQIGDEALINNFG